MAERVGVTYIGINMEATSVWTNWTLVFARCLQLRVAALSILKYVVGMKPLAFALVRRRTSGFRVALVIGKRSVQLRILVRCRPLLTSSVSSR